MPIRFGVLTEQDKIYLRIAEIRTIDYYRCRVLEAICPQA